MTGDANWRDDGACCGAHPDLFFPFGTTGAALRQIEEAKRMCRVCPVQTQCLAWALENGVTDGVWGGTTPDERRVIRALSRRKTFSEEDDTDESYQRQSTENKEYVRRLLKQRQPRFSAALELALVLAELELTSREMPGQVSGRGLMTRNHAPLVAEDFARAISGHLTVLTEVQPARMHSSGTGRLRRRLRHRGRRTGLGGGT